MKLVTWNVNSLTARLPRLLELLDKHAPDVVCLQETKVAEDAFPELELRQAGYDVVHHSGGRWAGVAILAKAGLVPKDVVRGLQGEPTPEEARWVEATVGDLRIASVYVVNGRALDSEFFEDKLLFLDAMAAKARLWKEEGVKGVIAGDFNVAPADVDVYDPAAFEGSTHVTRAERERVQALLDLGYADAHVAVNGADEVGYTWWDYRQGHFHRKMGLRIDLVVVDEAVEVRSCGIDRDLRKGSKPSDHAPLLVELGA